MPTVADAKSLPADHHWHPSSHQAQQIARELRERELAMYEAAQATFAQRLADASAPVSAAEPQPAETPPSNEAGAT